MLGAAPLLPTPWPLDPGESRVEFALRHLGVTTISGRFGRVGGSVHVDVAREIRRLDVVVDADSLATGHPERDARLLALGVFGSEAHPTLRFRGDWSYEKGRGREGVQGTLTMHGATHVVELIATTGVVSVDAAGRSWYAATATGTLDRRAWGVAVHPLLDVGGLLLGHEVRVELRVRARVLDAPVGGAAGSPPR
jgi:polyisoprenoid-binding protein YceI